MLWTLLDMEVLYRRFDEEEHDTIKNVKFNSATLHWLQQESL